jgi:hypothetical protein
MATTRIDLDPVAWTIINQPVAATDNVNFQYIGPGAKFFWDDIASSAPAATEQNGIEAKNRDRFSRADGEGDVYGRGEGFVILVLD